MIAGSVVPAAGVLRSLLLPESVLDSGWFAVLAAFVAINTVMYASLAVAKLLPKVYVSDWFTSANRRSRSRGIYPEGMAEPGASRRAGNDPRVEDSGAVG